MKKYAYFALVFVLTAALFTGCGCTNRDMNNTSAPTTQPTTSATTAPTQATTHATTEPTIHDNLPGTTDGTIDHGNGPLENGTTATENTVPENRARQHVPGTGNINRG